MAVLRKLAEAGVFGPDDVVVAFITGAGLKTVEAVSEVGRPAIRIRPTMRDDGIRKVLEGVTTIEEILRVVYVTEGG